jgi:hypothetical protein
MKPMGIAATPKPSAAIEERIAHARFSDIEFTHVIRSDRR